MKPPFIQRIKIQNLLSFDEEGIDLELKPLNVLIGANASGKTNLLKALKLVANAAVEDRLARWFAEEGGARGFLWSDKSDSTTNLELTLNHTSKHGSGSKYKYNLDYSVLKSGLLSINKESLTPVDDRNRPQSLIRTNSSATIRHLNDSTSSISDVTPESTMLSYRFSPGDLDLHGLNLSLIRCTEEGIFLNLDLNELRRPNPVGQWSRNLLSDCSNLAAMVNNLDLSGTLEETILPRIREVYENVDEIRSYSIHDVSKIFTIEKESKKRIPIDHVSDGILRFLAIMVIIYHPDPPPLICIDEPEIGLHPDVIPQLAYCIEEASENRQFIITTHSPEFVDALSAKPESVVVCERENSGTKMRRLKEEDLDLWLDDFSLGDLWMSGELGGTRY